MAYTVQYGQSIYDVAVQVYGDVNGVGALLRDNPDIDLGTVLVAGQVLETGTVDVTDSDTVNFLKNNEHVVTNFDGEGEFTDPDLEENFLVTEDGDYLVTEDGDRIKINI